MKLQPVIDSEHRGYATLVDAARAGITLSRSEGEDPLSTIELRAAQRCRRHLQNLPSSAVSQWIPLLQYPGTCLRLLAFESIPSSDPVRCVRQDYN
jgi:hypothetical protein